jgi:hypothetical protein
VQNLFKYEDDNLVLSINMDIIFAIRKVVLKVYVPRSGMNRQHMNLELQKHVNNICIILTDNIQQHSTNIC